MNRIHTAILALVMSIFLIQAIDPPFEKPTGTFLQFYPLRNIPQSRSQELISKDTSGAQESSSKEVKVTDRQDNFPYSLTTELKPPPIIETDLKPPPPPPGVLINIVPDNLQQSSQNIPTAKNNKKLAATFRYLTTLGLNLPSLPIENSGNNNNQDFLYPPLNIEAYLNKLTPDQIQVLNQKIPKDLSLDFPQNNAADSLSRLRDYLTKIKSEYQDNFDSATSDGSYTVATFNGSSNDKVLGKDFINPLLKLYENEIHQQSDYAIVNGTTNSNGNFEDIDEEIKTFTQNELHLLIHGTEQNSDVIGNDLYNEALIIGNGDNNSLQDQAYFVSNIPEQNNVEVNNFYKRQDATETIEQDRNQLVNVHITDKNVIKSELSQKENNKNRRSDGSLTEANDKEHIGEILPPNFNKDSSSNIPQMLSQPIQISYGRQNYRMRKSFEPIPQTGIRRVPFSFPGERFRSEYEPLGLSADGADIAEYQRVNLAGSEQLYPRAPRLGLPPTEVSGFRLPRRYRGFRETYSEGFQPYFDNSARYQTAWSVRKPRVIFPTDLVAFRDSEQNGNKEPEPDWLSADNQLQDIQEQDTRDRGKFV